MKNIDVKIPREKFFKYSILIGDNLLQKIEDYIPPLKEGIRTAIITDSKVHMLYGVSLLNHIRKFNPKSMLLSFPEGERSKTRKTKEQIEDEMLIAGFARDSIILALGGGVVGDLAGFIASTYYRGIPFYQLPTTIIAMTDSSVGGKTGVDTIYGKNLIGTFYQPSGVIADIGTLSTLEDEEYFSGLAEVIKYGLIRDADFFRWINESSDEIERKNPDALEYMIYKSCLNKVEIVVKDERESGLRKILNFGHTVGHAIEVTNDFTAKHGTAVAIGMIIESIISWKLGLIDRETVEEIEHTIKNLVLSHVRRLPMIYPEKIIRAVRYDKKVRGGKPEYVILRKIGKVIDDITIPVEDQIILDSINHFLKRWI